MCHDKAGKSLECMALSQHPLNHLIPTCPHAARKIMGYLGNFAF
jgi:hypothetical protein